MSVCGPPAPVDPAYRYSLLWLDKDLNVFPWQVSVCSQKVVLYSYLLDCDNSLLVVVDSSDSLCHVSSSELSVVTVGRWLG